MTMVKGVIKRANKKESWKILDEDVRKLTKAIEKFSRGMCNSSLAFKQGYTGNPDVTYEDKI